MKMSNQQTNRRQSWLDIERAGALRTLVRALRTTARGLLLVAAVWAVFAVQSAFAQTPAPAEEPAAVGTPVSSNDVNDVARQLWCPLCSGVRLDACELKACAQMKDEIAIMLGEGQDVQLIKDTFVTRYGPQVLGEPPRSGFNWLAWVLPFIVLAGGGVYLYTRARAMGRDPNPAPSSVASAPPSDYERKLDAELKQYD